MEFDAPMVFQCAVCSSAVGDSLSMVGFPRDDIGILSLERVVGVTRSADLTTSTAGVDKGATYHAIHCANCQAALGKCYESTSAQLASLRHVVTLSIDRLQSFKLGSATDTAATLPTSDGVPHRPHEHMVGRERSPGLTGRQGKGREQGSNSSSKLGAGSAGSAGSEAGEVARLRAELSRMEEARREELFKVHKIMLNFAERIAQLEGAPPSSPVALPSLASSAASSSASSGGSLRGPSGGGGGAGRSAPQRSATKQASGGKGRSGQRHGQGVEEREPRPRKRPWASS